MADINDRDRDRDLGERGLDNQIEGTGKEMEGKVRKNLGDLTDDTSEQLKGKAKEMQGKVQKKFGDAEQDIDDASR